MIGVCQNRWANLLKLVSGGETGARELRQNDVQTTVLNDRRGLGVMKGQEPASNMWSGPSRMSAKGVLGWRSGGWDRVVRGTAVFLTILLLSHFWRPIWGMLQIVADREAVIAYLDPFGAVAPLLLSLVILLQIIVAAIPGHALLFASGYLYGFAGGVLLNLSTLVIGSQIAYFIARWFGRPIVERLTPVETLNKMETLANEKGVFFFMVTFMLPIFPSDVLNYAAGLSGITPQKFFVANFIGRLPVVFVSTAIGAYGFQLPPLTLLTIVAVSAGLFLLWRWGVGRARH